MNQWHELEREKPDGIGVIKHVVCAHCRNKFRHDCIEVCAPEGLYRNLVPMELVNWQRAPQLPDMSKLMDYAPVTRFAVLYLVLHYTVEDSGRTKSTLYHVLPSRD